MSVNGSSAVQACAFQLDVQWILDIIDQVSEFLRGLGKAVNTVFDAIGQVLEVLSTIADWFAWVPGIGEMAKSAIKSACDIAGDAAETVANIQAGVLQFCKNALAPWEIRSAGEQINEQIVPAATAFAQALDPSNLASNASWEGVAAERFRANAAKQHQYAQRLQEGTAEFGATVQEMGEAGVQATIDFVKGFFKAAVALYKAIAKLWAVPVGTAIAAADVIQLVMAIISMVKVWVEAIMAIRSQTGAIRDAAGSAAPTSQWPAIVR